MAKIGSPKVRGPRGAVKAGEDVRVKTLIKHPMESGLRKNKETGEPIPAHFIETVTAEYGGKTVMSAHWSGAVSKNPFFSFTMKAVASGPVTVTWKDNKGQEFSGSADIKVG